MSEVQELDRLHVVHISLGTNTGGMEKLLVEFARHADRNCYRLTFVSLEAPGRLAPAIESCGWHVLSLHKRPGFSSILVLKLARLLKRLRPDVVHVHNTAALLYGVPAARLAGVPTVVHTRHGQRFESSRRQTNMMRLLSRFVDHFVCVSHDSRELSLAEGIPSTKLRTIWNGTDIERFAFTGPAHDGGAVLVARLSPEKNVELLLRASAIAIRRFPSFRLTIAGDGACRANLEALTKSLGLEDRVCFLGETQGIPELLGKATLFVLPSKSEGVSLTLLEAMARGLPVVATNVGGNVEVVVEGETGFLVGPDDPEGLAEAIVRILADHVLAHRMGMEGRRRVEISFNVKEMVASYERLYSRQKDAGRVQPAGVCR